MKKTGVAEPAVAEWASSIVFVLEKNVIMCFCDDCRRLSAVTVRNSYFMPRMDEYIYYSGESTIVSTLDINSRYWQIKMDGKGVHKTAFETHNRLHNNIKMLFGLKNASATFQRAMVIILAPLKRRYALVYIDDTITFLKTPEKHLKHVEELLKILNNAGMMIKLKKYLLFSGAIAYLGHIITFNKVLVATKTTEAIKALRYQTTVSEL